MKRLLLVLTFVLAAVPAFAQSTSTVNTELPAAVSPTTANITTPSPTVITLPYCPDASGASNFDPCVADPAHGATDSGAPVKIGCRADSSLADNSLVSSAQRSDALCDLDSAIITRRIVLGDVVQDRKTDTAGTATAFTSGLAAPGSGVRLWITKCTFSNSSASNITVDLTDGSGGTALWTTPVPATSGAIEVWPDAPLKLTANTALGFDASAAATTLTVSCNGFKSKL
jgi:hypothetical protein